MGERINQPLHLIEILEQRLPARLGDLISGLRASPHELLRTVDIPDRFQLLQMSADRPISHTQPMLQRRAPRYQCQKNRWEGQRSLLI